MTASLTSSITSLVDSQAIGRFGGRTLLECRGRLFLAELAVAGSIALGRVRAPSAGRLEEE